MIMMKKLIILSYIGSPLLLIAAVLLTNPGRYDNVKMLGAMGFGIFGYTWLLWQFVLSARPKWIEKHFGLDKLMRFHGMMALVSIGIAALHKTVMELFFSENIMTQLGSISLFLFIGISVLSIIFLSPRILKSLPGFRFLMGIIEKVKIFTYERIKLIHNATIVALIMLQVHVLLTSAARGSILVFNLYMVYFFTAVGFYLAHKVVKPWFLENSRYIVSDLIRESADMWTVELKPKHGKPIVYNPGQFGFFKVLSDDVAFEEHPFSFSSTPSDPTVVSITVKGLGDFTRTVHKMKIGDEVQIEGPYGRFTYVDFRNDQSIVFIAGGVGITPILSMLRHMRDHNESRKVTLMWGVRTASDLIRSDELHELERHMPNFKWIPVVSQDESWQGQKGFIDYTKLQSLIVTDENSLSSTGYYICGPAILMDLTRQHLKRMGVRNHQVRFEKFSM
jgi:predicted ferric reductase